MVRTLLLALSLSLVACGGGSKPAAQSPVEDDPVDPTTDEDMPVENEQCCCDYVAEPSDDADDMTENHSYEYMSAGACEEAGGMCGDDDSACEGE